MKVTKYRGERGQITVCPHSVDPVLAFNSSIQLLVSKKPNLKRRISFFFFWGGGNTRPSKKKLELFTNSLNTLQNWLLRTIFENPQYLFMHQFLLLFYSIQVELFLKESVIKYKLENVTISMPMKQALAEHLSQVLYYIILAAKPLEASCGTLNVFVF